MPDIDRGAYDQWVELEIQRRRQSVSILTRIMPEWPATAFEPQTYDEWLKAGKPGENHIRAVLGVFGGRPDLYEPPTVM